MRRPGAVGAELRDLDDAIICDYLAEDEEALREHGRCGGFPVDGDAPVWMTVIDPIDGRSMR